MCYTELGCYTNRSVGLYSAKEILEYIEEMFWPDGGMGIEAICIMDYYSVQSFPSIKKHLEERNMCYIPKILFGVEIDVTHCAREYRTKCIAKTQNGIDKLYEIVSFANGKALTIEELSQFHEGIFIGLEDGCNDVDIAAAADFWYVTPDRSDVDILRMVRDVKTTGKPLCAASNGCYLHDDDKDFYELLQQREDMGTFHNKRRGGKLLSEREMYTRFERFYPDAGDDLVMQASLCIDEDIPQLDPFPYRCPMQFIPDADHELLQACEEKLKKVYGDKPDRAIRTRMRNELDIIAKEGYASQYVLAMRVVRQFSQIKEPTMTRGCSASSLISFLSGITAVNPLPSHYFCSHCHYFSWVNIADGFDLPGKACPHCGAELHGDGHNIPYEAFLGANRNRQLYFHINIPISFVRDSYTILHNALPKHRVYAHTELVKGLLETAETYREWNQAHRYLAGDIKTDVRKNKCSFVCIPDSYPELLADGIGLPPAFVPTCKLVKTVHRHRHSFFGLATL